MDNTVRRPAVVDDQFVRAIPRRAALQCGVFSTSQALADGWTSPALRHATASGAIHRLRTGAYQVSDLRTVDQALSAYGVQRWEHAGPAIGAVLTTPGAIASHSTAAVLRKMPMLFVPKRSCVTVVPWHTGEIARVHVHRCTSAPACLPVGRVECTTVGRTGIDLAREHGVVSGVIALDYALHEGLIDYDTLECELGRCTRWPGVLAAREAIARTDPLSESVLESRSRLKLADFGLPDPTMQVSIATAAGRFVGRVDFYWDEFGVVGEADGDVKYDGHDPRPLLQEKRRQEELERLGLGVVRWGTSDLADFAQVAARLRRTLARYASGPLAQRDWTIRPLDFDPVSAARARLQQRWRGQS